MVVGAKLPAQSSLLEFRTFFRFLFVLWGGVSFKSTHDQEVSKGKAGSDPALGLKIQFTQQHAWDMSASSTIHGAKKEPQGGCATSVPCRLAPHSPGTSVPRGWPEVVIDPMIAAFVGELPFGDLEKLFGVSLPELSGFAGSKLLNQGMREFDKHLFVQPE